jgi:hypothetical protein
LDRPTGTRITGLLAAIAISTLAIATLSVIGSRHEPVRPLFDSTFRAQRLTRDVQRFVAAGRRYALTADAKERALAEGRQRELQTTLELAGRSRAVGQTEDGRLAFGELQRAVDTLKATVSTAMRDVSPQDTTSDRDARVSRLEARLIADYTAYHQQLDAILELVDRQLRAFEDQETIAARTRWFVFGLGVLGFALGIATLALLRKHIDPPIPKVASSNAPSVRDTPIPTDVRDEPRLLG